MTKTKPNWLQRGVLVCHRPSNTFFKAARLAEDADHKLFVGVGEFVVPASECIAGLPCQLLWGRSVMATEHGKIAIQPYAPGIGEAVVEMDVGLTRRKFSVMATNAVDVAAAKLAAAFDGVVVPLGDCDV